MKETRTFQRSGFFLGHLVLLHPKALIAFKERVTKIPILSCVY